MMSRLAALAVAAGVELAGFATPSRAMPVTAPDASGLITTVAGGCGPGLHPDPWGRCVPNRFGGPAYASPAYSPAFRRPCPPGLPLGPYGRRSWPNG
jgi:hypothetical protein